MKVDIVSGHAEGRSLRFVGHQCINFMPVSFPKEDTASTELMLDVTPGLTVLSDTIGRGPVQGMCRVHDKKYCIIADNVCQLSDASEITFIGTITSFNRARIIMIPGGNDYILICAGVYGYVLNVATNALTKITDIDFPGAEGGIYQDGYWLIIREGTLYYSQLQDPFSWSGTDVLQASHKPSNIKAIGSLQEEIYLIGEQTIEVFYNDGTTPFVRRTFSTLAYGIASADTLAHVDNSLIFLSRSFDGTIRVVQVLSSQMYILSTDAISWELSKASSLDGSFAIAYAERGHTIYAVTVPNLNKTYVIDLASKQWHVRQSYYVDNSDGIPILEAWRANCFLYTGSDIFIGDRKLGKIYKLDFDVLTEDSSVVERIFETKTFSQEARYITLSSIELDCETGLGGGLPKPQLALQASRDGGKTWSAEKWRHIGAIGEYQQQVIWHGLGRARDWKFKFLYSGTTPIKIGALVAHGSTSSA